MNIAIDMMGGDFAPAETVKGVAAYLAKSTNAVHLQLIGDATALGTLIKQYQFGLAKISIVDATQTIGYHDHPVKALREKPQSSIALGFGLLAAGGTDAFISAGNTGAMLVGSMFSIKPMPGVLRPTIATILPREHQKTGLLLDVGINADCKPENLNQFAQMGAAYAQTILGIVQPRVALLNIGEEEGKGNALAQAAYPLLKQNTRINFVGNVEGRDILEDTADVIVCDGFTGNVLLKLLESIYPVTKRQGIEHPYFNRFHFEQYGGTPVLGIERPVIIGHGVSGEEAFMNMICLAEKMLETRFLETMGQSFAATALL
jgi:glycerol-3-phosphate acyltransferase PlsX